MQDPPPSAPSLFEPFDALESREAAASSARLARVAAESLRAPLALLTLALDGHGIVLGSHGLPEAWRAGRRVPAGPPVFPAGAGTGEPLVLDDAREHPVLREHRVLLEHGAVAWASAPLVSSDGRVSGALSVMDIRTRRWSPVEIRLLEDLAATATSLLELHLRRSGERYPARSDGGARQRLLTAALDGLQEGVCILSPQGEYLYVNETLRNIFGPDCAEGFPGSIRDLTADPEQLREQDEHLGTALKEGRWSGRIRRTRPSDGREIQLDVVLGRVDADRDGESLLFGIVRDSTEEITREQQLRRVERLDSLATLIGGVAHELNNPLNAVLNFAQLLAMDETDPGKREDLKTIEREVHRMARIVADLKQVARSAREESAEKSAVDLNEVVRHVLRVQDYRLRNHGIVVKTDLAEDLIPVFADRSQMEQVVLNLVINAQQAMSSAAGEGRLILRTRASAVGAALHVVDDGPGIPPHLLQRIFDPFFTTRSPGEGTGLGLSLVHGVIADHGGEVHVESEVGKGTAFRVDLPRAVTPDVEPAGGKAEAVPLRPLRVLVVDDEVSIRRILKRLLTRRGHGVDEAVDGTAALAQLETNSYDVVLSDVRMPGMGGEALLDHLRERGLADRVILMTGDVGGADVELAEIGAPVLFKPMDLQEVATAVETVGARGG